MENKIKILCIGSAGKDVFFPTVDGEILETPEELEAKRKIAFELGAKYQIADRYEALGGCAANVSTGLARLGFEASCLSKVGRDITGRWIKDQLRGNGVEVDLLQEEEEKKTDLAFVIDSQKAEDRLIFFNRDANENLEVHPELLEGFPWIFVGALNGRGEEGWAENLQTIIDFVEENKVGLIYNPGQRNIRDNPLKVIEAVKRSKILVVNKDEATAILVHGPILMEKEELADEKYLLQKLQSIGPEIVAITDGVRGAWAIDSQGMAFSPSLREEIKSGIKDTTGAGDAFTVGFLGAYFKEKNLAEMVSWGIANSANSIRYFGGTEGMFRSREIEKAGAKPKAVKL